MQGPTLSADDWQRLQLLFHSAMALPPHARAPFVQAQTDGAPALRQQLERLLAADDTHDATLQAALADTARQVSREAGSGWLGRRLGPWRITRHLADGGMGAVYLAERDDGAFAQRVALKLLNPAWCSAEAQARFDAERQILARLEHPSIARLLDGGRTDDGVPWLAMAYVDGEPIDAWCRRQQADIPTRLRLFVQVCRAVEHAHQNLVVHRDIKPGNILVDRSGQPRLLDFGIAKLGEDGPGLTRTGERLLTPSHASPEQVTGGVVTTTSDVYALGVLLFELLTGRRPYGTAHTSPAELVRMICETQPPRPSDALAADQPRRHMQALKGDLDNIVLMALRKEPARRYASAAALADDLERHLAHRPVRARADTLGYRMAKAVQRHPVAVPVSVLALLLALAGAGTFVWRLQHERDRALAAEAGAVRAADFVASLLEATRAEEEGTGAMSVDTLLDKASRRVDAELGDDPQVAARVRHALGRASYSWYRHEPALAQQQAALAALRRLHTAPHRDVARVLTSLGNVTHGMGRLDESLDWAQQALREWRAVGTPAEQAEAEGDVGSALNSLRRLDEARVHLERAVSALRVAYPGDHFETAFAMQTLAYNRHRAGAWADALGGYEAALAMYRRLGTKLPQVADLLQSLAALHVDMGDLEAAERVALDTLPQLEALYGGQGRGASEGMLNRLALVAHHRGHTDEALRHVDLALDLAQQHYGREHRYAGALWVSRTLALVDAGRLAEADAALAQALRIRAAALAPDSPDHLTSATAQAALALARDNAADAERVLRPWVDRTPPMVSSTVDLHWQLGLAVALQGRTDEGRTLSTRALGLMPESHWKRQALAAALQLPPFAAQPDAQALADARHTLQVLATRLGDSAPWVLRLRAALRQAEPG